MSHRTTPHPSKKAASFSIHHWRTILVRTNWPPIVNDCCSSQHRIDLFQMASQAVWRHELSMSSAHLYLLCLVRLKANLTLFVTTFEGEMEWWLSFFGLFWKPHFAEGWPHFYKSRLLSIRLSPTLRMNSIIPSIYIV